MSDTGIMREGSEFEFDIPYIDAVQFAQFPGTMAREALIVGQRPPPLDAPFTYCDMGCGTGGTLLMLAASFPDSQFYGVDLSPAHIEHAEAERRAAGVENLTYFCGSFAEAANTVPECEYITAHGILSWIPEEAEDELLTTVQTLLKPGGLFQLSANMEPGWGQMTALRRIMRTYMAQAKGTAEERLRDCIRRTAALVNEGESDYGKHNPVARAILKRWANVEAAYVGHEMLAGAWRLFSAGEMIRRCADFGLECCGPLESHGKRNAEKIAALGLETDDVATLEDFLSLADAESFRTMVFTKPGETGFERAEMTLRSSDVVGFPVAAKWSNMTPEPETPLAEWTAARDDRPHTLHRIFEAVTTEGVPQDDLHSVAYMVGGALTDRNATIYARPALEVDVEGCAEKPLVACHKLTELSLAKPRAYRHAGYVPSPVFGGGVPLRPAQSALLRAFLDGAEDKVARARELIAEMDPKAPAWGMDNPDRKLPDPAEEYEDFVENQLPFLLRLGVIETRSG